MTERPILFSAPMVQAILSGRKSQTRRVVKPKHAQFFEQSASDMLGQWGDRPLPYGQAGDRLWVREAWSQPTNLDPGPTFYRADYPDCVPPVDQIKWKPSIHMPRWASRITLEITGVRVERLQGITVSDAIAEGYDGSVNDPVDPAITWYAGLWNSINGPGSWEKNPWVWVVEFRRV